MALPFTVCKISTQQRLRASVRESLRPAGRWQAEKLSESQLYSLGLLLLYWTTGIYIPGGAVQLVLGLPNSRHARLLRCCWRRCA